MVRVQAVTTSEAAKMLGVDRRTVARWTTRGKVYGYPIPVRRTRGGHARINVSELRAWAEQWRVPGAW